MNFTKLVKADLDSPRQELSNGGLGFVTALAAFSGIGVFICQKNLKMSFFGDFQCSGSLTKMDDTPMDCSPSINNKTKGLRQFRDHH